jgi:outer membrane protein OmpA-like peptidoglycan-associated protein
VDDHIDEGPWPSFADLLGATTLLFLVLFAVIAIPALTEARGKTIKVDSISSSFSEEKGKWEVEKVGDYVRVRIPENATFEVGKYDLGSMRAEGKQTLLELGQRINAQQANIDQVQVVGHTSVEGVGNLELSSRRATTIALLLINQANVDPCLVTALGRGPLYPVDPDGRRADLRRVSPADRRIELEIRPSLGDSVAQANRRAACITSKLGL